MPVKAYLGLHRVNEFQTKRTVFAEPKRGALNILCFEPLKGERFKAVPTMCCL